jgi:hypothetical protein
MEIKVHIGNKWWKIMTIYSKEVKTTRRLVKKIGKRRGGMGKENPKTRWKMQRGRD